MLSGDYFYWTWIRTKYLKILKSEGFIDWDIYRGSLLDQIITINPQDLQSATWNVKFSFFAIVYLHLKVLTKKFREKSFLDQLSYGNTLKWYFHAFWTPKNCRNSTYVLRILCLFKRNKLNFQIRKKHRGFGFWLSQLRKFILKLSFKD